MTVRRFLDTNVVVYLLAEDPLKAEHAEQLLADHPCISTQVVNEFISVCMRKLGLSRASAYESAHALMTHCEVLPVTATTIDHAMQIAERFGFSHWDALIVAAAQMSDCTVLYTEDMQHGQQIGKLRLSNPFMPDTFP